MTRFCTLLSLVCAVVQLLAAGNATRPGIQLCLTDNGLQYVDELAVGILEKHLSKIKLPNVAGDADTKLGHISYKLSSVKLKSLTIPKSSLKTVAGVGLQLKTSGISLSMSGNWHYRRDSWPHISGGGSFDLDASSIAFSIAIKLGADPKGHPNISAGSCSGSVGDVSIHFHGGASWLYNLFHKIIEHQIRVKLQNKLCEETKTAIDTKGEKAFESFPTEKAIDKYSLINFALVENPRFTTTLMAWYIKGEFMSVSHPTEAPFSPSPLPSCSASTRMAYVWLTDYVLNTAGLVYQKAGRLAKNITSADLPKNFSFPLNTKTFKYLIPQLYSKYPNLPIEIDLYATEPPHVDSDTSGVSATINGNAVFRVILPNGSKAYCFTLAMVIHGTAQVAVKKEKITVHVTLVQVKASVVRSEIGDISAAIDMLDLFLKTFADKIIIHEINVYGDQGFPLPVIKGVQLTNTKVTSGKHFNLVATDFKYTPPSNTAVLYRKKRRAHAQGKFQKRIPII